MYKAVGFHLVAKNATRWNSQLRMIAALLKAIDKDRKLQSKLNATKKWGELSHHELGVLKELTILLQPFEDATNDLQGDYETTGNVIPCYLDLLNKVSVTIKDSNGKLYSNPACPFSSQIKYCKPIASVLKESLTRRLSYVLRDTFYVLGNFFKYKKPLCLLFNNSLLINRNNAKSNDQEKMDFQIR